MASKKWNWDKKDVISAVRHTLVPLVAGGIVAALESAQSGEFTMEQMKGAAITAILAGVLRLLHRFTVDFQKTTDTSS